jgi:hypothetical protein
MAIIEGYERNVMRERGGSYPSVIAVYRLSERMSEAHGFNRDTGIRADDLLVVRQDRHRVDSRL